jgi:cell division septation protein DedD
MLSKRVLAIIAGVALCVVMGTSCASVTRDIRQVEAHPTKNVTLLQSYDTKTSMFGATTTTYQFWYCTQEGNTITCQKNCGNERKCPTSTALDVDVSPSAVARGDSAQRSGSEASEPEPSSSDETESMESDPMESDEMESDEMDSSGFKTGDDSDSNSNQGGDQ